MLERFIDNKCEDSLTASVFSHLLHLPCEVFWKILRNACCTKTLPEHVGEFKSVEFWPKWDPKGSNNNTYVEPDVFIRFDNFDLILEAKIAKDRTQGRSQWQNELISYANVFGKEKQSVRMIALGGIHSEEDESVRHESFVCIVHMCRWSTVLLECQRLKKELEETNKENPSPRTFADIRILDDLTPLFAVHGYPVLQWFADLDFKSNLLDPKRVGSIQQRLRTISQSFHDYEFQQRSNN